MIDKYYHHPSQLHPMMLHSLPALLQSPSFDTNADINYQSCASLITTSASLAVKLPAGPDILLLLPSHFQQRFISKIFSSMSHFACTQFANPGNKTCPVWSWLATFRARGRTMQPLLLLLLLILPLALIISKELNPHSPSIVINISEMICNFIVSYFYAYPPSHTYTTFLFPVETNTV